MIKRSVKLAEVKPPVGIRRRSRASGKHPALNETGLKDYWDLRSKDYANDTGIGPSVYSAVVEYLLREGIFLPGDTVLDVGCGPGTFSLLFADRAKAVVGLDVSEGMLSMMMGPAKASGRGNIRPICSSWEKYDSKKKFDLVFSSFCPAVNDAETLLKMEERSRRSCCCITSVDADPALPVNQLWELLAGKRIKYDPPDVLYPFNILYFSDRAPSIRLFKYETRISVPSDRLVEGYKAYFKMYMDLDESKITVIKDYVASISTDGVYRAAGQGTLNVIFWDK